MNSGTSYDSYIICTSPRSGSTLLCKLLLASGVAGNPESYFHEPSVDKWMKALGISTQVAGNERKVLEKVFSSVIATGSGATKIFGLRLQRESYNYFAEKLSVLYPGLTTDAERLNKAFGKVCYLHLTRKDKVQQAVSLLKAEQTGLWHLAPDGTELERLSPPKSPVYDAKALADRLEELIKYDQEWNNWFETEGVQPFRVYYEDLSEDPASVLSQVLKRLGVNNEAASKVEPRVAKLADSTSKEWVDRFRLEFPDLLF